LEEKHQTFEYNGSLENTVMKKEKKPIFFGNEKDKFLSSIYGHAESWVSVLLFLSKLRLMGMMTFFVFSFLYFTVVYVAIK
jgi:hypothetical protein